MAYYFTQNKVRALTGAHEALTVCLAYVSYPFAYSAITTLSAFAHTRNASASGSLHWLFCLPGILFAQISHSSVLDLLQVFFSNVTFSVTPFLTTLFRVATLPPILIPILCSRSEIRLQTEWVMFTSPLRWGRDIHVMVRGYGEDKSSQIGQILTDSLWNLGLLTPRSALSPFLFLNSDT